MHADALAAEQVEALVAIILRDFPSTQAIYLFGSYAQGMQHAGSDVDVAVLLPVREARVAGDLRLSDTALALSKHVRRDVDLVNLRLVSTVFQNQIIHSGKLIYSGDEPARREFEMLTLSFYMKLNEERADILRQFRETRRAYDV
ncbi:MAG: nucleotidyltransferase domain-containing protein [Anaerolineae bacterium]|nr:nucleotidyltransferase domain-containing protein [Candidatus Roseilinea sp.]MDW8451105.1 nucleotidyltransferase domain-containing protein [Anaerolineae bacterium]